MGGIAVTTAQVVSVVGVLAIDWKDPMRTFIELLGVFAFDLEIVRFSCVVPLDPLRSFCSRVFVIVFFGLVIWVADQVSRCVDPVSFFDNAPLRNSLGLVRFERRPDNRIAGMALGNIVRAARRSQMKGIRNGMAWIFHKLCETFTNFHKLCENFTRQK